MRLKPIDQQVVVIVGASSGIGRATAHHFAKRGVKLVVSARSQPGLASLVAEIQGQGGAVTAIPADVAEFAQV
jgi:short-subunit dehydrogenase